MVVMACSIYGANGNILFSLQDNLTSFAVVGNTTIVATSRRVKRITRPY